MRVERAFFDSNVLLYLASGDDSKASAAENLLAAGGVVSVQVLNEVASVAMRKMRFTLPEVRQFLGAVRSLCEVVPLTTELHDSGLSLMERYQFSLYDSMVLAAALQADCHVLFSEDMQHGQKIESRLQIRNPFHPVA